MGRRQYCNRAGMWLGIWRRWKEPAQELLGLVMWRWTGVNSTDWISHHSASQACLHSSHSASCRQILPDVSPGREGQFMWCHEGARVVGQAPGDWSGLRLCQLALGECPRKLVRVENLPPKLWREYVFDLVPPTQEESVVEDGPAATKVRRRPGELSRSPSLIRTTVMRSLSSTPTRSVKFNYPVGTD